MINHCAILWNEFLMGEIWNHIDIFLPSTAKFLLESHNVDVVLKPYYFIHYIFTQLILWWTFKVFKWNFQRFDCMFNDCLPCQSLKFCLVQYCKVLEIPKDKISPYIFVFLVILSPKMYIIVRRWGKEISVAVIFF